MLIYHSKRLYDDGAIAELKLWAVPSVVRGSAHKFKYSLYHGRDGQRLVGYDNEAGKAIIAAMATAKRPMRLRRQSK